MTSLHRKIVDKIDKDKDGKITAEELGDWIKFTKEQYNEETVNQRWKDLIVRVQSLGKTVDPTGSITWDEYKRASYGKNPGIKSLSISIQYYAYSIAC